MKHDIELTSDEVPLACTLPGPAQVTRGVELGDLFTGVQQTRELADGYVFRFPGNPTWANRLLQFILGERSCCPFFTFELAFEPKQGPIWLHIRGPEGVKVFIMDLLKPEAQDGGNGHEQ